MRTPTPIHITIVTYPDQSAWHNYGYRMRVPGRHVIGILMALLPALSLAACSGEIDVRGERPADPPRAISTQLLLVDFESLTPDSAWETPMELDDESLLSPVLAAPGGLRVVPGPGSTGQAVAYPADDAIASGARAVVRVVPEGHDRFAPKDADFGFGADVMYPHLPTESAEDNGDNVLQRGLFGDKGQFKLQLDDARPGCRIAGGAGEVLVKAQDALEPGQWYRIRCERVDDVVSLFVAPLPGDAPVPGTPAERDLAWLLWQRGGETGTLSVSDPPATLSVGGKLNAQGSLVEEAPDQFSGILDNVVIGLLAAD